MTVIEPSPRRWDPVVKLTHWSVVAAIIGNALIVEEGSAAHIWIGYALASVLALHLIWGIVGPRRARFVSFPPNPVGALRHIGDIVAGRRTDHASHNPLGALMVYAIWATLGVVIASGVAMSGLPPTTSAKPVRSSVVATYESHDANDQDDGGEREEAEGPLAELHEAAVNLLYILIVLHVAGVIFETRRSGRQILMAILPTRR